MLSCNLKNVRKEALNIQSSILSATLAEAKAELIRHNVAFPTVCSPEGRTPLHGPCHVAPQCFYSRSKFASTGATLGFSQHP